jgi:simple sugar transport system permease protein
VRTATPLILAALGESVTELSGIINVSLEGSIIAGAFAAFVGASVFGSATGYLLGTAAGFLIGGLLALFVVVLRMEQIVTGTALTMFALGLTGTLYRGLYGSTGVSHSIPTSSHLFIPGLASIPGIGPALFDQPWVTYAAYILVPLVSWHLYRTHAGLAVRSVGAAPYAAAVCGVRVARVRALSTLFGSGLAGLAGATLVLAQAGTFAEGMSAGRGFIAIAIVALGRWHPTGVLIASVVFGAAMAVQYVVQALGWHVRYELVLMIPYLLTLIALGFAGRGGAPNQLGRSDASLS